MKKNTLQEILQVWEKEDWFDFEKYINSPFCLTHKATASYLMWVKSNLTKDPEEWRELAALALQTDPSRVYHLHHYAMEAVHRFLAWQSWNTLTHQQSLHTIRTLRRLKTPLSLE